MRRLSHGTLNCICMHINAVASGVMLQLHLWHYCHNIISEIKGKFYTSSGPAPPPHPFTHPMKSSWCAPIICLRVSRNCRSKRRLCPWTTLSSWSLLRRRLVFSVRYELCFLYSVVTELMLHDMPRSLWQWWSAVRCWLFDGHNYQFVVGSRVMKCARCGAAAVVHYNVLRLVLRNRKETRGS